MARRRGKTAIRVNSLFSVVIGLGAILLVTSLLSKATAGSMDGVAILVLLIIGLTFYLKSRRKKALAKKILDAVGSKIDALVRRQAQLLIPDAYGATSPQRWYKEIDLFFASQVIPSLRSDEMALLKNQNQEWVSLVDRLVSEARSENPAFREFSSNMSPTEFEVFCAEELQRAGWDAHATKSSRDQGVDVVAQKKGVRLVFQCKLYNQPVGNKAVQEVVAARAHESAQFGAVVSNNRYTAQAHQLANTNRVALLHYGDLRNIDAIIRQVLYPSSQGA